jgi:hypothetical protein
MLSGGYLASSAAVEYKLYAVGYGLLTEFDFPLIHFLPTALAMLGLLYFVTRNPRKKFEYAGYAYLFGFVSGFLILMAWASFAFQILYIVGVAAIGFTLGVGLSFISTNAIKVQLKEGAPAGQV